MLNKNKVIIVSWNDTLYYFCVNNTVDNSLQNRLYTFVKNNFLSEKRLFLIIKGLGIKITLYRKNRCIKLKLGNSHPNYIYYSSDVFVSVRKTLIFFKSFNKVVLGNLVSTIKELKSFSDYKDKGIFYRNEKRKLKNIKKK
jgi:ribosomal protein L6P/L9E